MGCVIAKANDDTVYINNSSNYSSTKTHDSFVVECYDKDGTMLTSKKTSHNILDSVRLKKTPSGIKNKQSISSLNIIEQINFCAV